MDFQIESRREAWDAYWANGSVQSCVGKFSESADDVVSQFWLAQLKKLPKQARVLDLATGNGSVPKLILSKQQDVQIDAVDLAKLAPNWVSSTDRAKLQFHTGVEIENLPFSSEQFDLVTSQFGVEYAQWPVAIKEALRVSKCDGIVSFVLHNSDSEVVRIGRAEFEHQQLLLAEDGLLAAASTLLPKVIAIQTGSVPDLAANTARLAYNNALTKIENSIQQSDVPDLLIDAREYVHSILSGRIEASAEQRYALLADYTKMVNLAVVRTSELLQCALDGNKLDFLLNTLRMQRPNAQIEHEVLQQDGEILAYGVTLTNGL